MTELASTHSLPEDEISLADIVVYLINNLKWIGNPPLEPKVWEVKIFSIEEVLNEEIKIPRQPNHWFSKKGLSNLS